ncbi:MAG: Rrf2 family transcriptional regulator [Waddliaceae bacterium]|jgi:Rrf2 family protein|nr:Rrf2 family transcriptional regulator [Waddliaceae bacterium]MBT3579599.1 Rrf2 family transcriptional regulator [Waddliaceae bacterium]MBT4444571.1 Rrf2 family transcriptional regulator [Waddliaceae bacterium]MBT6929202.1 Rrf2 family transcriptional regulator [Waddliaceae bacterium]MBT7263977.1 Rrf2 family transcriptional regulator [Waddliaceae bacterium]
MKQVLGFSKAAALALHVMVLLAEEPLRRRSISDLANTLSASSVHLAKILQRLSKSGLVNSISGPSGGFLLSHSPVDVSLAIVYESIDGPLSCSRCLFDKPVCNSKKCILGDLIPTVSHIIEDYLKTNTLHDITTKRLEIPQSIT